MSRTNAILNVSSASSDWRACALANYPLFPFILDDVVLVSVEGFIQGIKFPDTHPSRAVAFLSYAHAAKQCGDRAERVSVWWRNNVLGYGSDAHHALIGRAIRAKFYYNQGAQLALRAAEGLELKHDIGPELPTTSLPAAVFCRILTDLRDELLGTGKLASP
jgi:hypothetical protein